MKVKKETPLVIVDTDAILAQIFENDANHKKGLEITKHLTSLDADFIYLITTITEATTTIQRKFNRPDIAHELAITLNEFGENVKEVNSNVFDKAIEIYSLTKSKKNTLFDCINLAYAKNVNADAIFSFDGFYKKLGFKLASEL